MSERHLVAGRTCHLSVVTGLFWVSPCLASMIDMTETETGQGKARMAKAGVKMCVIHFAVSFSILAISLIPEVEDA